MDKRQNALIQSTAIFQITRVLSLCFNCHYFLIGTQKLELVNSYGFKLDLSLFAMVSSIISIAGILFSASWTTKPIQNQTHVLVALLAFLPLFLFRMLSWLLIITCLDLFSFIIIIGLLVLNWIVLILTQDRLHSEPLKQSLLSLVFPVYELPTSNTDPTRGLKFLFCLTLSGNIYLAAMLATLFSLYSFEIYNPWCSHSDVKIKFPERIFGGIMVIAGILCIAATVPSAVCFAFKHKGQVHCFPLFMLFDISKFLTVFFFFFLSYKKLNSSIIALITSICLMGIIVFIFESKLMLNETKQCLELQPEGQSLKLNQYCFQSCNGDLNGQLN